LPNFSSESQAEVFPKAKLAADKALAIDDNLAEAHVSRGLLLWRADLNFKEAKREFVRAIELNPNYAPAHYFLAVAVLAPFGQFDQAIAELKRAVELDPFSMITNAKLGYCYFLARHYPEAVAQFRKTTELDPNFPYLHTALGEALELNGDSAGAMREYEKAYEIGQDLGFALLAHAYALKGDREKAFQLLGQLQDIERRKGDVEAYSYAIIHLSLGENDQAIDWLERSYRAKELPDIGNIKVNPMLDPLRGDPRFEKLANQVLPPDVRYSATPK
jgi:serine/threonine-protein kinase